MFKYTNSSERSTQQHTSQKTSKSSTIPKPIHYLERPMSGSHKGSPGTPQKDKTLSERYTNRAYNRLPSPKARFQTVVNVVKDRPPSAGGKPTVKEQQEKTWGRPQSPKPPPRPLVKRSCSDITNKSRPLDMECNKNNIQTEVDMKTRPRTSHSSRAESAFESKVLHTVSNVLSQALLQQGKIDETNLKNIIDSMRDRLYDENNLEDEELSEIDVESKPSRTAVNESKPSRTTVNELNLSEDHFAERKSKVVAGIVRRDQSGMIPERKPYRKIYDQMEESEVEDKAFVCVDLPDSVFPKFPSLKKAEEKCRLKPNAQNTASKQNVQMESTNRDEFLRQFEDGDSQKKDNHFWNPSEDAKLRAYIESLINNMKNQVNCGSSVKETEGEIDSQGTFCRSFCVCKVCISKNNQSKTEVKHRVVEAEECPDTSQKPKEHNSTVQKPATVQKPVSSFVRRQANNRVRSVKTPSKGAGADAPFKFIKNTDPNFHPESSLNTSLTTNSSYTVVDTGDHSEDGDDKYLQRRFRKPPSRKPSAKIN